MKRLLTWSAILLLGLVTLLPGAVLTTVEKNQLKQMGRAWSSDVNGYAVVDRIQYLNTDGNIVAMGNASVAGTVTAGKFTDGTLTITGGAITGVTGITLSGTLGVSGNLYATGTITAGYTGSNHAFTGNLTATGTISGASRTGSNVFFHNPLYLYSNQTMTGNFSVTGSITGGSAAGATAWLNTGLTIVGNSGVVGNLYATGTITAGHTGSNHALAGNLAVTGTISGASRTGSNVYFHTPLYVYGNLYTNGTITGGGGASDHRLDGNLAFGGTITGGAATGATAWLNTGLTIVGNSAVVGNLTATGTVSVATNAGAGVWLNANSYVIGTLSATNTVTAARLTDGTIHITGGAVTGALNLSGATVTWPALAYSTGGQRREIPLYSILGGNGEFVSTITTSAYQFALLPTTTGGAWGFWNTSGHVLQGAAGGATTCSLYGAFVWQVPADFNSSGALVAEVVTRGVANSSALAQSAVLSLLAYELDGQGGTVTVNLAGAMTGLGTLSAQWDTLTCAITVNAGGTNATIVPGDQLIFYLYEWSGNVTTAVTITPQIGRISVRYAGHE